MEKFNTYVDSIDLGPWRELCDKKGTVKCFRKGESFACCGDSVKHFGLIRKGYFKYTVADTCGEEHITGFAFSGCPVGDALSIVCEQPLKSNIIAAATAEVMMCPVAELKHLFEESPMQCRILFENLFRQAYTQYLDLYRLSPKERYLALLKRCPDILQNITLKELASYLQITPTHLSRIRKELTFTDTFPLS